ASGSMYGSHAHSAKSVNAHYTVATTTVDDIVAETGIIPALVKIDVEAAESFVLKGATKLAMQSSPVFMVEMHGPDEMPMQKNAQLVLDWCKQNNYTAYYMTNHSILTNSSVIA